MDVDEEVTATTTVTTTTTEVRVVTTTEVATDQGAIIIKMEDSITEVDITIHEAVTTTTITEVLDNSSTTTNKIPLFRF